MLDILLLTILTEKDEVERTSALVFLEEHGKSLVWDEESGTDLKPSIFRSFQQVTEDLTWKTHRYQERLRKVYFVLENILGSPVDGQGMAYSLKSQAYSNAPV